MPKDLNISLGGITISLIADHPSGEYAYIKRAEDFRSPLTPEINLQIHCGRFPDLSAAPVFFETNVAWHLLKVDGKWAIDLYPNSQNPRLLGIFPDDFRSGDIYTSQNEDTPDRFIFPLASPLGELFTMNLLGTGLGMLFHATGVIDQGKGYLFTGFGGVGKTTTARLWEKLPGIKVVNDDKVIIRKEADGFRLYGTPWHGEGGIASPDSAPLTQVFVLKQATKNYTAQFHPAQAASKLLARAFVPLWDADKIAFTLNFLDELSQTIPCQELGFLPDSSAVDFVRASL